MTSTISLLHSTASLDGSQATSTQSPKRHQKLWFDDGSVILQVENTLFRVHLGILYSYSTTFKDMVGLLDDASMMDGCPVVMMGDDPYLDWVHTLNAIYDMSYLGVSHTGLAFFRTTSALRVSTKYHMDVIRRSCISCLQRIFPVDFDGMLNWQPELSISYTKMAQNLLDCEVPSLLAVVLYKISASYPIDGNLDDDLMQSGLPYELMARCLSGRSRLYAAQSQGETALVFEELVSCLRKSNSFGRCKGEQGELCRLRAFEATDGRLVALSNKFPSDYMVGISGVHCYQCFKKLQALYLKRQKKIWESLPKYFGLGVSWTELKEREVEW